MRKLILGVLLVLVVVVGGGYGYVWFKVKRAADDFVEKSAMVATISYEGIHISPGGEVGLKGLRIRPRMVDDEIRIAAVTYRAESLIALFNAEKTIREGKLPRHLGVSVQGLEMGTTGALAELQSQLATPATDALESCDGTPIGLHEMALMGYRELHADLDVDFKLEGGGVTLTANSDARGVGQVNVRAQFGAVGFEGRTQQLMTNPPELQKLSVHYKDAGYTERFNAWCASRKGMSSDDFATARRAELETFLGQIGVAVSPELVAALGDFISRAGELRLTVTPSATLSASALGFYRPGQVVAMLRPELSINGKAIEVVPLEAAPTEPPPQATQAAKAEPARPAAAPVQPTAAPTPAERGGPTWRTVAVRDLQSHVGWPVRVTLTSGSQLEGRLEKVRPQEAVIQRRFASGSMSQPAAFADIERVEVWR